MSNLYLCLLLNISLHEECSYIYTPTVRNNIVDNYICDICNVSWLQYLCSKMRNFFLRRCVEEVYIVCQVIWSFTFDVPNWGSFYEWVSDLSVTPKWAVFQIYHGENRVHFNEMMMSALYNTVSWIFIA